jgi:hypothetical protein
VAFPSAVTVQIGFTNSLSRQITFDSSKFDDTTTTFGSGFTQLFDGPRDTVSTYMEAIETDRGRDDMLSDMNGGVARITLHDPPGQVGYFNPLNSSSPLAGDSPGFSPMRPVKITATLGGTVHPVYMGYIRGASYERVTKNMGRVTITAVDLFMWLARVQPRDARAFTGTTGTPTPSAGGDAVTAADAVTVQATGTGRVGLMRTAS